MAIIIFVGSSVFCKNSQEAKSWTHRKLHYNEIVVLPSSASQLSDQTRPTEMWGTCGLWLHHSPLSRSYWWTTGNGDVHVMGITKFKFSAINGTIRNIFVRPY